MTIEEKMKHAAEAPTKTLLEELILMAELNGIMRERYGSSAEEVKRASESIKILKDEIGRRMTQN